MCTAASGGAGAGGGARLNSSQQRSISAGSAHLALDCVGQLPVVRTWGVAAPGGGGWGDQPRRGDGGLSRRSEGRKARQAGAGPRVRDSRDCMKCALPAGRHVGPAQREE
jgi:hypothetical protein